MSIISRDEWLKVKNRGKVKYILINWVLLAAIPVALFMSVARVLIKKGSLNFLMDSDFFANFLMYIILCTVISVLFGFRNWNKYNKLFESEV